MYLIFEKEKKMSSGAGKSKYVSDSINYMVHLKIQNTL